MAGRATSIRGLRTNGPAASRTATTGVATLPKATCGKPSMPCTTSGLKTDIRWNGSGGSRRRPWISGGGLYRKEIHLVQTMHSAGGQQRLRRMRSMAASLRPSPWTAVVLEGLRRRTRFFSRAREVYPDLYETHEFNCLPQWFGTGSSRKPDHDPADRNKLERLSFQTLFRGDGESCDEPLCAGLARLEAQEINAFVVSVEGPAPHRKPCPYQACGQLVMSPCGDALRCG